MLSFWQHCDGTNSRDGAFRRRFYGGYALFCFSMQNEKKPVFLCNWVHYWEGFAFTDTKLL